MNPVFSAAHTSFIWNYYDDKQQVFSWLVRFPDEATLATFQGSFGECMYEVLHEKSWAKVEVSKLLDGRMTVAFCTELDFSY